MHPRRVVPGIAVLAGMVLLAATSSFERSEAVRLREHFAVVERELLAREVSSLTAEQRAARAEQISQLRRYAARGEFPRNHYLPGTVPFFRDGDGNLCAMAFLIAASGRGDLVDHVARTRNNAYVPELADQPGLAAWLDRHGLTLAEAARIQPSYGEYPPREDGDPSDGSVIASVSAGGLSLASMLWNARSMDRLAGHRTRTLVGIVASGVNLGLGLAYVGKDGPKATFGVLNLAVGAAAMALGVRALSASPRDEQTTAARLRVVPIATGGPNPRFGLSGQLRF